MLSLILMSQDFYAFGQAKEVKFDDSRLVKVSTDPDGSITSVSFPATHGGLVIKGNYYHFRKSYHLGDHVVTQKYLGKGWPELNSSEFLVCAGFKVENRDGTYGFFHAMGGGNAKDLLIPALKKYEEETKNKDGWKISVTLTSQGDKKNYEKSINEVIKKLGLTDTELSFYSDARERINIISVSGSNQGQVETKESENSKTKVAH